MSLTKERGLVMSEQEIQKTIAMIDNGDLPPLNIDRRDTAKTLDDNFGLSSVLYEG